MQLFVIKLTETFNAFHSKIPTSVLLSQEDVSESQLFLQYLAHFLDKLEFLTGQNNFLMFDFYFFIGRAKNDELLFLKGHLPQ